MARRRRAEKRELLPDAKFNSLLVGRFVSRMMLNGKKTVAEKIIYWAFDLVGQETKRDPLETFEQAIRNATPILQVKPRRVGGATYQVPVEIRQDRRVPLAMRWLIQAARARKGQPMAKRLAAELMEASRGQGAAVKRREDLHRMAEANRAFVHYRW